MYEILSTLNVNIVNILFPILDISSHVNKFFYKKILEINDLLKIETIDLNEIFYEPYCFKDKLHLKPELSFSFGIWLNEKIIKVYWKKPKYGEIIKNSYIILKPNDFNLGNKNEIKSYSNSLVNLLYLEVKSDFYITTNSFCKLIAIGYVKEPNECQGLIIDSDRVILSRYGYLVELLDKGIDSSSMVCVKPLVEYGNYFSLGNREYVKGYFSGAKIVELIFKADYPSKVIPAERYKINLSLELNL